jgi:hypothetical protein
MHQYSTSPGTTETFIMEKIQESEFDLFSKAKLQKSCRPDKNEVDGSAVLDKQHHSIGGRH